MAKLENYVELARQTMREISADGENWRAFLTTASNVYKYGFYDQLMIYAQRPDATACASFELWTNTMRRYVRRGAKGIALLDMTGDVPRYHYVFDAADTGNCVLLNHQSIAIRRGDANIWLGIDVVPAPQPCSHGVLVGAADVDTLGGLHRGSKFRLALRLRFAEDVFDDALAGRWVVSRGVTPLPPTIAAFADVALTVGAFLGH